MTRGLIILAVVLTVAGCRGAPEPRVASYTAPALLAQPPCRIVIVPFDTTACSTDAGPLVTEAVTLAMHDAFHNDVVVASPKDERLIAESALWKRGRVDTGALIEAQKAYLADAFLFGAITQYKPYEPPMLGLKLRMLSATSGDVLWAGEAILDARDQAVRDMAISYFKHSGLRDKLYGPDLIFMSPKQYATFVAVEMVNPLKEQLAAQSRSQASPAGRCTPKVEE